MVTLFHQILTRLTTCNGVAIDDHMAHMTQLFDRLIIIKGVANITDAVVVAVNPDQGDKSYSLNSLYIGDDGMVHVSKVQVGCAVGGKLGPSVTNITAIAK